MVGGMANLAVAEIAAAKPAGSQPVPVIEVAGLKKHFPVKKGLLRRTAGYVYAVDGVSFSIDRGETLGLVGESGCGKSTVARTVLRLVEPTAGTIKLDGDDITRLGQGRDAAASPADADHLSGPVLLARTRACRPATSSASRCRCTGSPMARRRSERVAALFDQVGLRRLQMRSFPHEFSGGQRQRICIARALALNPKLIIGDEPVSALDVSIQAQVINLMMDLQREKQPLLPVHRPRSRGGRAHQPPHRGDVSRQDRRIHRQADPVHQPAASLHRGAAGGGAGPQPAGQAHEARCCRATCRARSTRRRAAHFHTRCPYAEARCKIDVPALREVSPGHRVACHLR